MDEQQKKETIIDSLISEIESYRRPDRTIQHLMTFLGTLNPARVKDTVTAVLRSNARRRGDQIAKMQKEVSDTLEIEKEIGLVNLK